MISKIYGVIDDFSEASVEIEISGVYFDVLMTPYSINRLKESHKQGDSILLSTKLYIEAGIAGGNFTPRLIGFLDKEDARFFEIFITVKGLGEKKALKALNISVSEIANAIETSNINVLKSLPGFGGRMADKVIAELKGKVTQFASGESEPANQTGSAGELAFEEEALEILIGQLGYRRIEAENLLRSVLKHNKKFETVEELIQAIFASRASQEIE